MERGEVTSKVTDEDRDIIGRKRLENRIDMHIWTKELTMVKSNAMPFKKEKKRKRLDHEVSLILVNRLIFEFSVSSPDGLSSSSSNPNVWKASDVNPRIKFSYIQMLFDPVSIFTSSFHICLFFTFILLQRCQNYRTIA